MIVSKLSSMRSHGSVVGRSGLDRILFDMGYSIAENAVELFADLPPDHPFWAHPRVTVTPHLAAATRPLSAARVVAENIRRGEAGEPLLNLVDRARGY